MTGMANGGKVLVNRERLVSELDESNETGSVARPARELRTAVCKDHGRTNAPSLRAIALRSPPRFFLSPREAQA